MFAFFHSVSFQVEFSFIYPLTILIDNVLHAHDGAVLRLLRADTLFTVGRMDNHAITYVDRHVRTALAAIRAIADDVALLNFTVINAASCGG